MSGAPSIQSAHSVTVGFHAYLDLDNPILTPPIAFSQVSTNPSLVTLAGLTGLAMGLLSSTSSPGPLLLAIDEMRVPSQSARQSIVPDEVMAVNETNPVIESALPSIELIETADVDENTAAADRDVPYSWP